MRIVCPNCQAAYDVPDAVIAAGRKLRCAKCARDFVPGAASEAPVVVAMAKEVAPPAAVVAEIMAPAAQAPATVNFVPSGEIERLVQAARRSEAEADAGPEPGRGPVFMVAAAWVISFGVLGVMAWAFLSFRAPIMQAWPPSTRVYAVLGYSLAGR